MASIRKRPDRPKPYLARYRAPDGRQRSRSFARKVDADRWLSTQTADVARGAWVDPALGRMTFAEWVPRWEAGLHDLRPTTRVLNTGIVRNHLLPRFGSYPLAQITTSDVKAMVADDLTGGECSSSAARRRVLVLRQVLAAAAAEGRIGRNPCDGVKLPPEDTREMLFLEPEQVVTLVERIHPAHYRPLVLTAAYVGLRWGELAGLRVTNVVPLRRTIRVTEQLVELQGGVQFAPPKTAAGTRTVTMPSYIAELLGQHMDSPPVRASGLVFPNTEGRPMRRSPFRSVWRRAVAGTKRKPGAFTGTELEALRFHDLRHTAAALAIGQGAHPLVIRDRLGHSSITVTMDRYGHLMPSLDEAVAEGLDQVLRKSLETPQVDQVWTNVDQIARSCRSEAS